MGRLTLLRGRLPPEVKDCIMGAAPDCSACNVETVINGRFARRGLLIENGRGLPGGNFGLSGGDSWMVFGIW